jgi:hypothetical protein
MTTEPDKSEDDLAEQELLAVRGIGPSVAQHLTDMGLGTLETLATAAADEVVERAASGPFRPGRQRVQEWIDQARRLLDTGSGVVTPRDGPAAHSETPSARVRHTFTLEVQTNDARTGAAVATKIVDVESQAFDTWSGWDPQRLVRFVAERSGLDRPVPDDRGSRADDRGSHPDAARPQAAPERATSVVRGYGVLESQTLVAGGHTARAVLRVGHGDTGDPDGRTVEWDLACGPAEGRADIHLTRERIDLVPGDPVVSTVELVVPQRIRRARFVAVVQIVGAGAQPRLVHVLADTTLEVVALS